MDRYDEDCNGTIEYSEFCNGIFKKKDSSGGDLKEPNATQNIIERVKRVILEKTGAGNGLYMA